MIEKAHTTWSWTDLIANYNTTGFCCHYYEDVSDSDDNLCESNLPHDNSTRPVFNPVTGHIVTDRTTGSIIMYNSTTPENASGSAGAASATLSTATAGSGSGSDGTKRDVAIGVGVGVPLMLALLALSLVAWQERRKLVRERARWTSNQPWGGQAPYAAISEQKGAEPEHRVQAQELDVDTARHELSPVSLGEGTDTGTGSNGRWKGPI
ncbi:MAG: hypothetical protein Q9165_000365 [Trypethelium subeluteriae]